MANLMLCILSPLKKKKKDLRTVPGTECTCWAYYITEIRVTETASLDWNPQGDNVISVSFPGMCLGPGQSMEAQERSDLWTT